MTATEHDLYPELSESELFDLADNIRLRRANREISEAYRHALRIELIHVIDHLERGMMPPKVNTNRLLKTEST